MTGISKFQGSYPGAAKSAVAISAIDARLSSKTTTFKQAGVPTSTAVGDEWIDADNENRRYVAASVGATAITAGQWEEVPTRILSTADSGERVVIRNDGTGGGIAEFFTGVTGETEPSVLDPTDDGTGVPILVLRTGRKTGALERAFLSLKTGATDASEALLTAKGIRLAGPLLADTTVTLTGNLDVSAHATFAGTGWVPVGSGGFAYGTGYGAWTDTSNEAPVYKRVGTTVTVRGLFRRTSGTGSVMLTLPAGARPSRSTFRVYVLNGTPAALYVDTAGQVTTATALTTGWYVAVDIQFDTDQP